MLRGELYNDMEQIVSSIFGERKGKGKTFSKKKRKKESVKKAYIVCALFDVKYGCIKKQFVKKLSF